MTEESRLKRAAIFKPIGRVRGKNIELKKRMTKALDGIEGFSHIVVLFWLHKARKPDIKIHPKGVQKIHKIGYLSTRTPHRHNPIGMTVVQLIKRQKKYPYSARFGCVGRDSGLGH
jgi:tRNA (adenine37-N6)-methyltransferase